MSDRPKCKVCIQSAFVYVIFQCFSLDLSERSCYDSGKFIAKAVTKTAEAGPTFRESAAGASRQAASQAYPFRADRANTFSQVV